MNVERTLSNPHAKKLLIALDGPGASGKGNLGRRLAAHFDLLYLDTGKLYRAVAYQLIQSNFSSEDAINADSEAAHFAEKVAQNLDISLLDSPELGTEKTAMVASIVSALPAVRKALLEFQRKIAESAQGAVLDGRDIGTIVCPDADFKFFVTATLEKRAERRYKELQKQNDTIIHDDVLEDLRKRDERDLNKAISPMKQADDAILIDTTDLSIQQSFEKILSIVSA